MSAHTSSWKRDVVKPWPHIPFGHQSVRPKTSLVFLQLQSHSRRSDKHNRPLSRLTRSTPAPHSGLVAADWLTYVRVIIDLPPSLCIHKTTHCACSQWQAKCSRRHCLCCVQPAPWLRQPGKASTLIDFRWPPITQSRMHACMHGQLLSYICDSNSRQLLWV